MAEMRRQYSPLFNIPAEQLLIVPVKTLGDEVVCDVRWEDENGELHLLEGKVFIIVNLERLDPMADTKLHELWEHYYGR